MKLVVNSRKRLHDYYSAQFAPPPFRVARGRTTKPLFVQHFDRNSETI